jgi:hypothetical protein
MKLPLWVRLLVLGGVLLLVWAAIAAYNERLREQGRDEVRAAWSDAVRKAQAVEDAKAAERRAKQEKADATHAATLTRLAADNSSLRDASERLRQQLAAFLAAGRQPRPDSTAAPGRPSAEPAGDYLLAELFRESVERAGQLATALDASHAAGTLCAASYDALIPSTPREQYPVTP